MSYSIAFETDRQNQKFTKEILNSAVANSYLKKKYVFFKGNSDIFYTYFHSHFQI